MRFNRWVSAIIGLSVLCLGSCSTSRTATSSKIQVSGFKSEDTRDTVREQVVVAIHDTLREVTTITVQLGQAGDTVRVAQVTERDRLRDRSAVRDAREKSVTRVDTVYIERRDSSFVKTTNGGEDKSTWGGRFRSTLKWIFALLCVIVVLIITVKVCLRRFF